MIIFPYLFFLNKIGILFKFTQLLTYPSTYINYLIFFTKFIFDMQGHNFKKNHSRTKLYMTVNYDDQKILT